MGLLPVAGEPIRTGPPDHSCENAMKLVGMDGPGWLTSTTAEAIGALSAAAVACDGITSRRSPINPQRANISGSGPVHGAQELVEQLFVGKPTADQVMTVLRSCLQLPERGASQSVWFGVAQLDEIQLSQVYEARRNGSGALNKLRRLLLSARVEHVAQAVARQVEGQDGDQDGQPREEGQPRRVQQQRHAVADHVA